MRSKFQIVCIEQNCVSHILLPEGLLTNFAVLGGKANVVSSHLPLQHFNVPDTQLPPVYSRGDSVIVLFFFRLYDCHKKILPLFSYTHDSLLKEFLFGLIY